MRILVHDGLQLLAGRGRPLFRRRKTRIFRLRWHVRRTQRSIHRPHRLAERETRLLILLVQRIPSRRTRRRQHQHYDAGHDQPAFVLHRPMHRGFGGMNRNLAEPVFF